MVGRARGGMQQKVGRGDGIRLKTLELRRYVCVVLKESNPLISVILHLYVLRLLIIIAHFNRLKSVEKEKI